METKIIGGKIAEARKKINISQAQLAQRLFISPQAVGKWERGESFPDILTFNKLANILGVDLNYFSENFASVNNEIKPEKTSDKPSEDTSSAKPKSKLSWDMSRGNWLDADFSGLNNLNEKFSGSNMQRCKFIGSDLSGLLLKGNNVNSCDFSNSDIHNSKIQSSHLLNNLFRNCLLEEIEFSASYVMDCDFSGSDFTGAVFKSCGLQNNAVKEALFTRTSFNGTKIVEMVFEGTIDNCSFENCSFKKVTFQHAKLLNTFFKNQNLKGIKFIHCEADRMTYEFLKNGKADLSGVVLV